MICKICNSDNVALKIESDIKSGTTLIYHCQNCGIKYPMRFPTQEELDKLYSEDYFKGGSYTDYLKDETVHRLNAKRYIKILSKYINFNILTDHWLDYGSAYGFLMDEVRKSGLWVDGIEICDDAIIYADKNLNLGRIYKSFPENTEYNICSIIGTLEHLIDPIQTLKDVNGVLEKDGYLLLTIPRYDGFWPLKWRGFEHLWYFNKSAIKIMLRKCGFYTIFCKNHWVYYDIEDALNKATTYFKLPFNNRWIVWICNKLIPRIKIPNNELICLAKKGIEKQKHNGIEILQIMDMK